MNAGWKYLMYAGIIFLIAAVAWEAYEVSQGERGEFSLVVLGMPKTTLFSQTMEAHLKLGVDPNPTTIETSPVQEQTFP